MFPIIHFPRPCPPLLTHPHSVPCIASPTSKIPVLTPLHTPAPPTHPHFASRSASPTASCHSLRTGCVRCARCAPVTTSLSRRRATTTASLLPVTTLAWCRCGAFDARAAQVSAQVCEWACATCLCYRRGRNFWAPK
eukprot:355276-Chlamydomonas_euryale.AAC.2